MPKKLNKYQIRNLFYKSGWSILKIEQRYKMKKADVEAALKIYDPNKDGG